MVSISKIAEVTEKELFMAALFLSQFLIWEAVALYMALTLASKSVTAVISDSAILLKESYVPVIFFSCIAMEFNPFCKVRMSTRLLVTSSVEAKPNKFQSERFERLDISGNQFLRVGSFL